MFDAVMAEVATPDPKADWKNQARAIAVSAHEAFLRHPWAAGLDMRQKPGPARLRYGDNLLGCFRNAGFSKELTYHAYHILQGYILGYTMQVLGYREIDTGQFDDVVAKFLQGDFAENYPHFTEHALQHMEPEPGQEDVDAYELGLDLILDGVERLRDEAT
jgi:hypothetical protein